MPSSQGPTAPTPGSSHAIPMYPHQNFPPGAQPVIGLDLCAQYSTFLHVRPRLQGRTAVGTQQKLQLWHLLSCKDSALSAFFA